MRATDGDKMGGIKGKSTLGKRICRQCGIEFMGGPRAWYCITCRSERRKQADVKAKREGPARHLGSVDQCVVCGKDYIVKSGKQKYCPDCAPEAIAEKDRHDGLKWYNENKNSYNPSRYQKRKKLEAVCTVCGKVFFPDGKPVKVCSDECRQKRKKQWQQKADAKRNPRNKRDASK